jgi:hypothetical protein
VEESLPQEKRSLLREVMFGEEEDGDGEESHKVL